MISIILLNYSRPAQLRKLIDKLRQQTIENEIIVINNRQDDLVEGDQTVYSTWNMGCLARIVLAPFSKYQTIVFMDDDLLPKDDDFLKDAFEVHQRHPDVLTGAFGRNLSIGDKPYSTALDAWGFVPIIKGRFVMLSKDLLAKVSLGLIAQNPMYRSEAIFNDDLYLSLSVGRGKSVHFADKGLMDRLEDIPDGVGLVNRPNHWQSRDEFVKWWRNVTNQYI